MRRNGKGLTGAELFWGTLGDEAASPGAKQKFKCEEKAMLTASLPAAGRAHCISRRIAASRSSPAESPMRSAPRGRVLFDGLPLC